MTAASAVSMQSGRSMTLCTSSTTRRMTAASSSPGSPTFTSKICAPFSCCVNPSPSRKSISPSRKACFSRALPVGLIRSPMRRGRVPAATACVLEETTVRALSAMGFGAMSRQARVMASMCAGVVPQQPPSSQTPSSAYERIFSAKSAGPTSYTVSPFSWCGRPAFGVTMTGIEETASNLSTTSSSWNGPRPQFTPSASTPSPSNSATSASGFAPVSSLPLASNVAVANTGRSLFSLAASTAAFSS